MSEWESYYKTEGEEEEEEEQSPDTNGKWPYHVMWPVWKKDFAVNFFLAGSTFLSDSPPQVI